MLRSKHVVRAAALCALAACSSDAGNPLNPTAGPAYAISDAAHAGAVTGFYFLPPLVKQPAYAGTFDAAVSPRVSVCELAGPACGTTIAQWTMSTGVTVSVAAETYQVTWHTDQYALDPAKHYRISVDVDGFVLGFADVDVVASGKELKNVDTNEYIALLDGRTLPIKFRIETGIAAAVDVDPDSASIAPGETQAFTAAVYDLHGDPIAAAVAWASSDIAVATIDAGGVASGIAEGTVTITATSGGASGTAVLVVVDANTPPVANDIAFDAIGNVTVPVSAPGVLANDTDPEDDALSAVPGTFATAAGGTVTVNADGSFAYLSAAGFTGTDSFQYQASDGSLTSAPATVTIEVPSRVWYADNAAAPPGDGRDASPFATLKAAESASAAGETVFVLAGDGTSGGYDEGFVFKSAQTLTGQGIASDVTVMLNGESVVLLAAGTAPSLTRAEAGTTLALAQDNTVQGVDVASTAGAGIAGSGFGTLTAGSVAIGAAGGPSLDLSSGTVAAAFSELSSAGSSGAGLRLVGVGGVLSAPAGSIVGAAGTAIDVTGGNANVTYGGNVASVGPRPVSVTARTGGTLTLSGTIASTGQGILVQGNGGGTIAFTGPSKMLSTGANHGVELAANGGAVVQFAGGGLTVATTAGEAFRATGGGVVTVTGAGNTLVTVGGVALRLDGISSGAIGISLQSVSATGGTTAIAVSNLGGAGLQVTGSGGVAGSGGSIEGTNGDAVSLTGTGVVSLRLVHLRPGANGVVASEFTGSATLERSSIDYLGSSVPGSFAVRFVGTMGGGSLVLDGTNVRDKLDGTAAVAVSASGTASMTFQVRDSDPGDAFPSEFSGLFGSAILLAAGESPGATAHLAATIRDSRFVNAAPGGTNNLELFAGAGATLDYTIADNVFDQVAKASAIAGVINLNAIQSGQLGSTLGGGSITGNQIRNIGTGSTVALLGYVGVRVAVDNAVPGIHHRVLIERNAFENLWRQGVLISSRDQTDNLNVMIRDNVIGTVLAPVGRSNRRGVEVEAQAGSSLRVEVRDNPSIVTNSSTGASSALHIRSIGANSAIHATVLRNSIGNANLTPLAGRFRAETVAGTGAEMCLDLRDNSLDDQTRLFELVASSAGPFRVAGPGMAVVTAADVTAANTVGTGSVTGSPTFNGGTSCPQPVF